MPWRRPSEGRPGSVPGRRGDNKAMAQATRPVTLADLQGLAARWEARFDARVGEMEARCDARLGELRGDVDARLDNFWQRVEGRLDAMESRMKDFVRQFARDVETNLRREFHGFAVSNELRLNRLETAESTTAKRLANLEGRVREIERRLHFPEQAAGTQ